MVASIGKIASPSQGAAYFEKDGYYARDDPAHREASAWAGRGAAALGLSGPVDSDTFRAVLEGRVPDGPRLGKRGKDGEIVHRPGRDVTLSAPKSVSLMAMVGGDGRIVEAHDRAVTATLGWIEKNAVLTRMQDPATGAMVHADGQKMVAATFRHDTSRNLDPQLHTHAVVANMVQDDAGKWRTMVNDGLYRNKMAIGAIYRGELAQGLTGLGYGIEKTHADGRFEIEEVPREAIDAFSTRRAEIEAAMAERGMGESKDNPHLADRAALLTRAAKHDVDKAALRRTWQRQAKALGFSASKVRSQARKAERGLIGPDLFAGPGYAAGDAAAWAVAHLAERQSVFGHADLLAATLAREPGAVTVDAAERAIATLERDGSLHAARGLDHGRHWTTDAAMARESETIALMRAGQGAEKIVMRRWVAETKLHRGRLNEGQKEAVKTILASKDRVVAVQGYAGTGKTTMLKRLRALGESRGYRTIGLAPSASAAKTLQAESGIESETLQRFLARHDGVVHGRGTAAGLRKLRAANAKTMLVVDESSLASSEQMRNLMRIATTLRLPRVVLVGDEKQLGAVEAGKPFAQLKAAGMQTAVMDDILRQRDAELKAAVRASLTGDVKGAFARLGDNIRQVEYGDLGAETARHWLNLPHEQRAATGVIAPTRALRDEINATIRKGLVAEGAISGPARPGEKLVARDLTRAQMARASNYTIGDTVIFTRPYKTLGAEKGDERRVARLIHNGHTVVLADAKGNETEWKPYAIAGAKGGVEVYRGEAMELRRGDRVRFTRNDPASGLANGETATVEAVGRDGVRFRLENGSLATLWQHDPQLRHIDRAFAATVHAFQGRTVDRIVAALPAGNPKLTDQRTFYVAISRARDAARLVTDDAHKLADQLERATGERLAALDATAKQAAWETVFGRDVGQERERDHLTRASDAMDRGAEVARDGQDGHGRERHLDRRTGREVRREREREHRSAHETGRGRDGKSAARSTDRERSGNESTGKGHGLDRDGERQARVSRQSEHEKAAEPKQKSRDFDLGM